MRVACVLRFADSIRETRNVAREPEELTLLGSGISVAGESDTAPLGERSGTGMDRTTAGARMDQGAKSYAAEFIGTFTLCFIGQGAICMTGYPAAQRTADAIAFCMSRRLQSSARFWKSNPNAT